MENLSSSLSFQPSPTSLFLFLFFFPCGPKRPAGLFPAQSAPPLSIPVCATAKWDPPVRGVPFLSPTGTQCEPESERRPPRPEPSFRRSR